MVQLIRHTFNPAAIDNRSVYCFLFLVIEYRATQKYDLKDAEVAITDAEFVLKTVQTALENIQTTE